MGPAFTAAAFEGAVNDARTAGASFIGESLYDGAVVFAQWPRADAIGLLPPELSLAPHVGGDVEGHPVVFAFGRQRQTTSLFGGLRTPTGLDYYEMAVIVPFVRYLGGRNLHSFIPRMYAGDRWVTWSGNAYWGFAKVMAEMRWVGRTFTVWTREDEVLVSHATVDTQSELQRCDRRLPATSREVLELLRLPVLGRVMQRHFVASYFDWDFRGASLRPVSASVSVSAALVPGAAAHTCHVDQGASFEVVGMRWRISWPQRPSF